MKPHAFSQLPLPWIILSAATSATLFLLATRGVNSHLLIYTPLLPLLMCGLAAGPRPAILAALGSSGLILLAGGSAAAMLYLPLFFFPASLFLRQLWRVDSNSLTLPDSGRAMVNVSVYAAIFIGILSHNIASMEGGLTSFLPEISPDESAIMRQARDLIEHTTFLVLGGSAWVQLILFYGIAVLANALLESLNRRLFPSLRLEPFLPPDWLMLVLFITGIGCFSGDFALQEGAKATFITLLFPYFWIGIAQMHHFARQRPAPAFWLLLGYVSTVIFSPFSFLGFLCFGLYKHCLALSNRFMK